MKLYLQDVTLCAVIDRLQEDPSFAVRTSKACAPFPSKGHPSKVGIVAKSAHRCFKFVPRLAHCPLHPAAGAAIGWDNKGQVCA